MATYAHFSNEMPPDADETDYANAIQADAVAALGRDVEEWEITNIRHHKHDGITEYHGRFLTGGGVWVIAIWSRDADGNQAVIAVHDHQHLTSNLWVWLSQEIIIL